MDERVDLRTLLEAERALVVSRLAALTGDHDAVVAASLDTNADDEHDPEGATIAFERSQIGALIKQAREHLTEVDRAVERLAAGTYGTCEVCSRTIPSGRLEARPTARRCVGCTAHATD